MESSPTVMLLQRHTYLPRDFSVLAVLCSFPFFSGASPHPLAGGVPTWGHVPQPHIPRLHGADRTLTLEVGADAVIK
jgi:hypothetical protein